GPTERLPELALRTAGVGRYATPAVEEQHLACAGFISRPDGLARRGWGAVAGEAREIAARSPRYRGQAGSVALQVVDPIVVENDRDVARMAGAQGPVRAFDGKVGAVIAPIAIDRRGLQRLAICQQHGVVAGEQRGLDGDG